MGLMANSKRRNAIKTQASRTGLYCLQQSINYSKHSFWHAMGRYRKGMIEPGTSRDYVAQTAHHEGGSDSSKITIAYQVSNK